ncbi:MAG: hypothetical protein JNK50_10895 [Bacteroidia bacterium]|nr:hypothetical protein [Bacteroidia bacterium]
MKTKTTIAALFLSIGMWAQTKQNIAVLNIDSKGVIQTSEEMGYLVRLELEKTKTYSVLDKYEVNEVIKANDIDVNNCYSKSCLVNAGKLLKADKMLSGSVERLDEKVVISLRIIDVASGTIEKTESTEFLNLPEIQKMIRVAVGKLVGIEPDPVLVKLLIDYDVPVESPKNTLRLNGPRLGFSSTLGEAGEILSNPDKSKGGFDMYPVNFQFGWQQEVQYISAGNFQALVENIFLIGGLESGKFVPSYTPLLGFRFGKGAWEFGFGPTFRLVRKANGFYDKEGYLGKKGEWHLSNEYNSNNFVREDAPSINPYSIESRLDSRGNTELSTGLVIAVGKTFRSGYLNIPVNIYVAPRKDGSTVGAMVGFNIQKKKRVN